MPEASSSRPVPQNLQDLQAFMAKTIGEVGRSLVKAKDADLSQMHEDDFYLYTFLYGYFKRKAIDQGKVDAIAASLSTVQILIHNILLPGLVGGAAAKKYLQLDKGTCDKTDYFPLLPQRTIREQMSAKSITLEAFGEVIAICNHIDELQGHKKAPFGVVNLLHFVAIAITLFPVASVGELIQLVADDSDIPIAIKYKIVHVWSVVDVANTETLRLVCDKLLAQVTSSAYSVIDIAALPAMVMNGPAEHVARPSEASTRVEKDPTEEVPAKETEPARNGPRIVVHKEDEHDEKPVAEKNTTDGEADFWARLAS